jgi:hypothetical protein
MTVRVYTTQIKLSRIGPRQHLMHVGFLQYLPFILVVMENGHCFSRIIDSQLRSPGRAAL